MNYLEFNPAFGFREAASMSVILRDNSLLAAYLPEQRTSNCAHPRDAYIRRFYKNILIRQPGERFSFILVSRQRRKRLLPHPLAPMREFTWSVVRKRTKYMNKFYFIKTFLKSSPKSKHKIIWEHHHKIFYKSMPESEHKVIWEHHHTLHFLCISNFAFLVLCKFTLSTRFFCQSGGLACKTSHVELNTSFP